MESKSVCVICGKHVSNEEAIKCSVCGASMHKSCARDESLLDSEESHLCPYDAMLAALDWFDVIATTYLSTLDENQKTDILSRLKAYVELLSK